jgi:hypothetical protein
MLIPARISRFEQFPGGPDRPLDLPQCAAAMVPERVERADFGERRQLVPPQSHARDEIVDRGIAGGIMDSGFGIGDWGFGFRD